MDKSSLFLSSNCSSSIKAEILYLLNLRIIPSNAKHLGLPLFFQRNKSLAFAKLKNMILSKISGWKAKLLSQAACTTLIKAVANTIPSFSMSFFLLPKPFCLQLNSALRKFWLGFPLDKKHNLTLLGWVKVCSPKAVGGLGLRTMGTHNSSLLAKIGWKLLLNKDLLWVKALAAKYLHWINFLTVLASPSDSWLWKGILKFWSIIQEGACCSVSSDRHINIWQDPWIPSILGFKPSPNFSLHSLSNLIVFDLITFPVRGWNLPLYWFSFWSPLSL